MATQDKVDVLIIGAGMAGSLIAAKLSAAGKKVVILESGPAWQQKDLISSDIWNRRIKWSGPTVFATGSSPVGHAGNAGWGNGGAGIHHFAQWPRMHPEDFKTFSLYGRGVDWPFSYDDLRADYDTVQDDVGICGDATKETWRPPGKPYPMPPIKAFRHAQLIESGFNKVGIATAPMPLAINTVDYKGRPGCLYDGWCGSGCPIGALGDPLAVYLPIATKNHTEIRNLCAVTKILTNDKGDRATGAEYYDAKRERHLQMASVVVIAGNAIQNARLLLNSATGAHPKGLANRGDAVGRYYFGHLSTGYNGWFDEELQPWFGVTGGAIYSQADYKKDSHGAAFGSYTWTMGNARKPGGVANLEGAMFGNDLHAFIKDATHHVAGFGSIAEQLPRPENRIELSDEKDEFGYPLARTVHAMDDTDKAMFEHLKTVGLDVIKATGAKKWWGGGDRPGWQHFLGGTRMGTTAENSVCNSFAVTHEIHNLALAGSGTFPTEGATHPTFTLHATSLRTANHLIKNWSAIAA